MAISIIRALTIPSGIMFNQSSYVKYHKMYSRRPVKINANIDSEAKENNIQEIAQRVLKDTPLEEHGKNKRRKTIYQLPNLPESLDSLVSRKLNNIKYDYLENADSQLKKLLNFTRSRKLRERNGIFLVEGKRTIKEALKAGLPPKAIIFSRLDSLLDLDPNISLNSVFDINKTVVEESTLNFLNKLPLYKASYKNLQMWSSVVTSSGIMGVFDLPGTKFVPNIERSNFNLPLTVILDEVREPTNLGGILRTLASVGACHVILTKGCCDLWEPKVLRSACGAHFNIKLSSMVTWDTMSNLVPEHVQIFMADIGKDSEIVMSDDNTSFPKVKMANIKENTEDLIDNSISMYMIDDHGEKVKCDPSYLDEEFLTKYENVRIHTYSHDKVNYFQNSNFELGVVLIIGGETGIGNEAKRFTYTSGGAQVAIPLANSMDSLNTGVATGIIVYEILKQFCTISTNILPSKRMK